MKNAAKTIPSGNMMDALANVQRRKLLVALLEHDPEDDAPVVIADSESESDAVGSPVSMQHVHVPKLVDYGFIEWNEDTQQVVKGPNFDEIRPVLELLDNHEDGLPAHWL